MSFILDALRKSENERQQNAPAEFSYVPVSQDSSGPPRWLWLLGGLLAINIALIGYTLASKSRGVTSGPPVASAVDSRVDTSSNNQNGVGMESHAFVEQVERARRQQPVSSAAPAETGAPSPRTSDAATIARTRAPAAKRAPSNPNFASLPSLAELRANGTSSLPDLHLDIHVFSGEAAKRFVFINMNKYRENDQLVEGPRVREISGDGVILDHDGRSFVLLRE